MKRIRYVSQFAHDLTRDEIDTLVAHAAAKNASLGVTGILMSSGRLFFQVIEGPTAHVDDLYQSIMADERHRDVLLLEADDQVTERFFPDWSMRRIDLDMDSEQRLEPIRELLHTVIERRRELKRMTLALEKAIWYELAAGAE